MTAQLPDILINEFNSELFGNLHLYRLQTGSVDKKGIDIRWYKFKTKPISVTGPRVSANWKGYIRTLKLDHDGFLFLWSLGAANPPDYEENEPLEQIEGDFWLIFGESFFAPKVYVPFRHGKIVPDKSRWFQDGYESGIQLRGWSGEYFVDNLIYRKN